MHTRSDMYYYKYKNSMVENMDIHNHNMQKNLDIHNHNM
jgi:hypothetical protein